MSLIENINKISLKRTIWKKEINKKVRFIIEYFFDLVVKNNKKARYDGIINIGKACEIASID